MQFTNTKISDKIFKIIVQYKYLNVVNKYECISFNEQLLTSESSRGIMVFDATFNNDSVISKRSVLLKDETRVHRENH
jgi:hypothetical protein